MTNNLGPALGYDESLGVPLCGEPGWRPDAADKLPWTIDDRGAGGSGLKKFLQAEADRLEGGPSTVTLHDGHGNEIAATVRHDGNQWKCQYVFREQTCQSLGESRDETILAATKYLYAMSHKPAVRELTERELNLIGSVAASGRVAEALDKYVALAVTGKIADRTLMSDPKYTDMLNQAVYYCWSQANHEYSLQNDDDFPFFLEQYARGKAHLTLELCSIAWKMFKEQRGQRQREAVVAAKFGESTDAATVQAGLEEASDAELRSMYQATVKALTAR